MIKNAVAYITRKKKRTFIIFAILTIVLSCLYSCLSITKASGNLENSLYKLSNSSLAITSKAGGYFDRKQLEGMEEIKEIEEIVYQYNGLAKPIHAEVVSGEQKIERDDLPAEFKNVLSLEASNNTRRNILFNSGVFMIKEGRNIAENDRRKILVHEEFAKKNHLKLGDEISLTLHSPETNELTKECKFSLVGIFSGKKQEKYTGLSSDFSENTVFIDYATSQEILYGMKNKEMVNKISLFSSSAKAAEQMREKIKELKIDWSQYVVEKDANAFEESLEAVGGIKHIIKITTYSIMLAGAVVLSLILMLWLRERIYEIGILLALGVSKAKIILQFIFELLFISFPAILASALLGNLLLQQMVQGLSTGEAATLGSGLLAANNSLSNVETLCQSYLILVSIIVLSAIVASSLILIKKPKEILSKIS